MELNSDHLLARLLLAALALTAAAASYGCFLRFQVLELLRKNPAGTIPVVLRRLQQKDDEWRKARKVDSRFFYCLIVLRPSLLFFRPEICCR